jgi:hypothetical protein
MLGPVAGATEERERAAALARRVTVGVVTALPEEHAAMLAMFERTFPWSFAGDGAGLVYDLGELPAHGGGRHVVADALAPHSGDQIRGQDPLIVSQSSESRQS